MITFATPFVQKQYQAHIRRWDGCALCDLCGFRDQMVLFRGRLPCDILFIGEAPGHEEDRQGYPFVGRAGEVLQAAIDALNVELEEFGLGQLSYGITNVVACFPGKDAKNRFNKPTEEHADACRDRLEEMVELASPKLVILLGQVPLEFCSKILGYRTLHVYHPSYILRRGGIGGSAYRSWWNEIAKKVAEIYAKVQEPSQSQGQAKHPCSGCGKAKAPQRR